MGQLRLVHLQHSSPRFLKTKFTAFKLPKDRRRNNPEPALRKPGLAVSSAQGDGRVVRFRPPDVGNGAPSIPVLSLDGGGLRGIIQGEKSNEN